MVVMYNSKYKNHLKEELEYGNEQLFNKQERLLDFIKRQRDNIDISSIIREISAAVAQVKIDKIYKGVSDN